MRITIVKTALFVMGLLFCVSCSSSDSVSPASDSFEGSWGLSSVDSETGVKTYSRLDSLTGDQDGYMFVAGGKLMIRNSGWCGTPPLSYFNFEGAWIEETKDILVLTYPELDEVRDFRLEILFLEENEMQCRLSFIE